MNQEFWEAPSDYQAKELSSYPQRLARAAMFFVQKQLVEELDSGPPAQLQLSPSESESWRASRNQQISVIRRQLLSAEEDNNTCLSEAVLMIHEGILSAVEAVKMQVGVVAAAEQQNDNQQEGKS